MKLKVKRGFLEDEKSWEKSICSNGYCPVQTPIIPIVHYSYRNIMPQHIYPGQVTTRWTKLPCYCSQERCEFFLQRIKYFLLESFSKNNKAHVKYKVWQSTLNEWIKCLLIYKIKSSIIWNSYFSTHRKYGKKLLIILLIWL